MKRPQGWTPEEKLAVVLEASGVTEADLGELLRQKGLHEAVLAERGAYLASESTFYRVLHAEDMQHHRRRARPPSHRPHACVADGPGQVASWDLRYQRSHVRGRLFYLFLVADVWSRKILGWEVHEAQSAELVAALMERIRAEAGDTVDLRAWVLDSDNAGPMKRATMLAILQRLGVAPSFSRPPVSDDNPYAEALFRTLKYGPEYPSDGFRTLAAARAWAARFVDWHDEEHLHGGIGYVTPADRHPGRWARHVCLWARPETVTLNPARERADAGTDRSAA